MIVPGRLTLLLAAMLAVLLVGAVAVHLLAVVAIVGDALLIGLCLWQGTQLRRLALDVHREHPPQAQVDAEATLPFRLINRAAVPITVRLRQAFGSGFDKTRVDIELPIAPGEIVRTALVATPSVRGTLALDPAQFEFRFNVDFARVRGETPPGVLKVFPTMRGLREYEALRNHHASTYAGLHRQRLLGAGREFEQLRDYGSDDDFRDINWKATGRRNKPITNVYQAERSRDVLLAIDCGRMMGNPVGGGTALDHAIDSAIMLAHVINRQGDRVGLALFRDTVHRFIKPAAGMSAVHGIIEELVEARTESIFPSYGALMTALRAHQNKRCLVLLFTDLNDPQLATNLAEVMPMASRKHVIVVISLRDPMLDRVAAGPAGDRRGVYEVLAARQLATERATHTRQLQKLGAKVLEADAGSLTMKALNMYLSIKSRQVL